MHTKTKSEVTVSINAQEVEDAVVEYMKAKHPETKIPEDATWEPILKMLGSGYDQDPVLEGYEITWETKS